MISDDPSVISPILTHLKTTFSSFKTLDIDYRKQQLHNLLRGFNELKPKIIKALELDLHNPASFTEQANFFPCIHEINLHLLNLDEWAKPISVATPPHLTQTRSYIQPEPLGVVLILGAWNYPFYLTIPYLAAALSAGNCVIVKPSELAANSSNVIAELVENYLDKDAYRCIEGAVEVSKAIVKEQFDKIMFTGSTEKGKLVAKAAAENLVPCILELGGKTPTIINREVNVEDAAQKIARAKLINCGQTCISCDYVFVHKDVKAEFIELYKQKVVQSYGDNALESAGYGRIINETLVRRLKGYIDEDHGGKLLLGGEVDIDEKYVAPTLIENPRLDSQLMRNEIFGPILPLYEFSEINEVIEFINKRDKPLAVYYYGSEESEDFKLAFKSFSHEKAVMEGHNPQEKRVECLLSGMNDMVCKPVTPQIMQELICRWVMPDN